MTGTRSVESPRWTADAACSRRRSDVRKRRFPLVAAISPNGWRPGRVGQRTSLGARYRLARGHVVSGPQRGVAITQRRCLAMDPRRASLASLTDFRLEHLVVGHRQHMPTVGSGRGPQGALAARSSRALGPSPAASDLLVHVEDALSRASSDGMCGVASATLFSRCLSRRAPRRACAPRTADCLLCLARSFRSGYAPRDRSAAAQSRRVRLHRVRTG